MQNFQGVDLSVFGLLEMNRFNNSKAFYDEHKQEIKEKARVPLQKLALDVSQKMYDIDEEFYIEPTRMVSRIRRDTRFTKDKTLYRQNVWMIFRHQKNEEHRSPVFWVEYCPEFYSYGVGYFGCTPDFMNLYRKVLQENPEEFASLILDLNAKGYIIDGESYKREQPGCPCDELKRVYNLKQLYFVKISPDLTPLSKPNFLDEFKQAVDDMTPMYKFLNRLHKRYLVKRSEDSE